MGRGVWSHLAWIPLWPHNGLILIEGCDIHFFIGFPFLVIDHIRNLNERPGDEVVTEKVLVIDV